MNLGNTSIVFMICYRNIQVLLIIFVKTQFEISHTLIFRFLFWPRLPGKKGRKAENELSNPHGNAA
jgi:hypothetical protein